MLKAFAATTALRLTGLDWRTSWGGGLGLAHVGEFAFVLVALSLQGGIVSQNDGQLFVAVGLASLMLSPVLLKYGVGLTRAAAEDSAGTNEGTRASYAPAAVVVVGIGPVGARIATMLETLGRDVCLIDRSPLNLQPFAQSGFRTIAGDATEDSILDHANVNGADDVIVCVPDDEISLEIVRHTRRRNTGCRLIVRCRFQSSVDKMTKAGANLVVSEEQEAAGALERALL